MREGASELIDNDVTRARVFDLTRAERALYHVENFLFTAMQMPARGIGTRIEWREQAGIDRTAHQQHRAIDGAAPSLDVRAVPEGCSDPSERFAHEPRALIRGLSGGKVVDLGHRPADDDAPSVHIDLHDQ